MTDTHEQVPETDRSAPGGPKWGEGDGVWGEPHTHEGKTYSRWGCGADEDEPEAKGDGE